MILPEGISGDGFLPWRPRHGRPLEVRRWEPRDPELLREVLDGLEAMPARNPVADRLAGYSDLCPSWRYAVVFKTTLRPMRLDINGGRDADLYAEQWQAVARLTGEQSAEFSEPELWSRDARGWYLAV